METGPIMGRKIWEVNRVTESNVIFTQLEWSKDMINEIGCMRRTGIKQRVKIRQTGGRLLLYKKGIGTFEPIRTKITILP